MIVESKLAHFPSLSLDCGVTLHQIDVAYESYGKLDAAKSNAILVTHAFSGDAHAAGEDAQGRPGWWDDMIGPGKGFDTNKYFVICSNVLGGCRGTTGPSSIDPATGKPYGMKFPVITIGDMVRLQKMLIDSLGIRQLLAVAGGSMGGMQVLEWVAAYPDAVRCALPIASSWRHSAQQIAFNEVGRQAIMADPDWNAGAYYDGKPPGRGLGIARMVGHITYMSDESMREKFGRRLRSSAGQRCSFNAKVVVTRSRGRTDAVAARSGQIGNLHVGQCDIWVVDEISGPGYPGRLVRTASAPPPLDRRRGASSSGGDGQDKCRNTRSKRHCASSQGAARPASSPHQAWRRPSSAPS